MGFKIDPKKIPEETDPDEKAWLMLYGMIERYKERGMIFKASDTNYRFCQTAVRLADKFEFEKKAQS